MCFLKYNYLGWTWKIFLMHLTGIWSRDFAMCACYPAKALTKANANLLEISQWNYRLVKAGTCLGSSSLCWLAHRGSKSSWLYYSLVYIYKILLQFNIQNIYIFKYRFNILYIHTYICKHIIYINKDKYKYNIKYLLTYIYIYMYILTYYICSCF